MNILLKTAIPVIPVFYSPTLLMLTISLTELSIQDATFSLYELEADKRCHQINLSLPKTGYLMQQLKYYNNLFIMY